MSDRIRVHAPKIIADEGTRILIGGVTGDGVKVAAHIILTTDDGVRQARRLREGDVAWIDLPSPMPSSEEEAP